VNEPALLNPTAMRKAWGPVAKSWGKSGNDPDFDNTVEIRVFDGVGALLTSTNRVLLTHAWVPWAGQEPPATRDEISGQVDLTEPDTTWVIRDRLGAVAVLLKQSGSDQNGSTDGFISLDEIGAIEGDQPSLPGMEGKLLQVGFHPDMNLVATHLTRPRFSEGEFPAWTNFKFTPKPVESFWWSPEARILFSATASCCGQLKIELGEYSHRWSMDGEGADLIWGRLGESTEPGGAAQHQTAHQDRKVHPTYRTKERST